MNKSEKTTNQEDALESENTEERENSEETQKSEEELDAKTLLAQKEYQREKRGEAESELKEARAEIAELKKQAPEEEREAKSQIDSNDPIEMLKTVKALQDYSSEELGEIRDYARGKGISLAEAAESDFVQGAISHSRSQVEAENKVPGTTKRGKTKKGIDFDSMSEEERTENWQETMRKAAEQGKGKRRDSGL